MRKIDITSVLVSTKAACNGPVTMMSAAELLLELGDWIGRLDPGWEWTLHEDYVGETLLIGDAPADASQSMTLVIGAGPNGTYSMGAIVDDEYLPGTGSIREDDLLRRLAIAIKH